ncbi:cAMP phosphodiesterase class-II [Colletotrichum cuscutae]|uniref:cAMP phosphodiesterase class-II n=1 Tax=Colletotrichum cuscutae TaxID=1209917 RepID=A0AAI9TYJ6_9PEZI|nr:cAMP phosphodiesterase class-II [Colletotrichum cuscutae]
MEDTNGEKSENFRRPALQVIVLGAGGGPQESNTTALLVRSVASGWTKGSIIAVDAGVHLSAITRILEETAPPGLGTQLPLPHTLASGPFAGLQLTPNKGGSPAIGDGESKGYLEVADRLAIKAYSVSHGHCIERHPHRGSTSSTATPLRYPSVDAASMASPRILPYGLASSTAPIPRAPSVAPEPQASVCVYDSSAYFILDMATNLEILIFGDVEPDSMSLSPRNLTIWEEAAPKIVAGQLAAIFIECSYDDSHSDDRLFGHLKPRYVMEEMHALAQTVEEARGDAHASRKRKRVAEPDTIPRRRTGGAFSRLAGGDESPISPKSVAKRAMSADIGHVPPLPPAATSVESPHLTTPTQELSLREAERWSETEDGHSKGPPLKGIKVVIIHVKDRPDGRDQGKLILQELEAYEADAQLGCEFIVSHAGQSLYL